ncbi:MAG TPA: hotdog domain-containing protein [Acidimicrobiales bacterium]|nr:hotdog domain-containing protein [Acidimicrobiales bacterium]
MTERKIHEPVRAMSEHVLGRIGVHAGDEMCTPGLHLHLAPMLFDPDGHVSFGVLGMFLDLASTQPEGLSLDRPFVHGDLSVQRLARPRGQVLRIRGSAARVGRRTAVVEIELVDEHDVLVAYSTQHLVFFGSPLSRARAGRSEFQRAFMARFTGRCTLDAPLVDVLDVRPGPARAGARSWAMPITPGSRNGFGGLHGGAATALVDAAVAGALADAASAPARTVAASLRYLTPGMVGPFRADPTILGRDGDQATVRVAVVDEGSDDLLVILAEARAAIA